MDLFETQRNIEDSRQKKEATTLVYSADILMITHNRAAYTELTLSRLLCSAPDGVRIWVWHNGTNLEVLNVVRQFRNHRRFFRFYHSQENRLLNEPTNWLWKESEGQLLGKVDDDCIVPEGWIEKFSDLHSRNVEVGVVACWHFLPDDVDQNLANPRVIHLRGHSMMRNCWVGGSGYLMKREAQKKLGFLHRKRNWTRYVMEMAAKGILTGWYYPLLCQDHLDDPRSAHTGFKTDEDVRSKVGLTSRSLGVSTIREVLEVQRRGVHEILTSSLDPKDYVGFRAKIRRALGLAGNKSQ